MCALKHVAPPLELSAQVHEPQFKQCTPYACVEVSKLHPVVPSPQAIEMCDLKPEMHDGENLLEPQYKQCTPYVPVAPSPQPQLHRMALSHQLRHLSLSPISEEGPDSFIF